MAADVAADVAADGEADDDDVVVDVDEDAVAANVAVLPRRVSVNAPTPLGVAGHHRVPIELLLQEVPYGAGRV